MIWLYALRDYAKENKLNRCLREAFIEWCGSIFMRELNKNLYDDFKPHIPSLKPYIEYITSLNLKSDYQLIKEFINITEFDKYPGGIDNATEDIIKINCTPIEITKIAKYGKQENQTETKVNR